MTVTELRRRIELWENAAITVSKGKSYTVDGLTYTRQDAQAIQGILDRLYARLACLLRGCSCHRASPIRPIDHVPSRRFW